MPIGLDLTQSKAACALTEPCVDLALSPTLLAAVRQKDDEMPLISMAEDDRGRGGRTVSVTLNCRLARIARTVGFGDAEGEKDGGRFDGDGEVVTAEEGEEDGVLGPLAEGLARALGLLLGDAPDDSEALGEALIEGARLAEEVIDGAAEGVAVPVGEVDGAAGDGVAEVDG